MSSVNPSRVCFSNCHDNSWFCNSHASHPLLQEYWICREACLGYSFKSLLSAPSPLSAWCSLHDGFHVSATCLWKAQDSEAAVESGDWASSGGEEARRDRTQGALCRQCAVAAAALGSGSSPLFLRDCRRFGNAKVPARFSTLLACPESSSELASTGSLAVLCTFPVLPRKKNTFFPLIPPCCLTLFLLVSSFFFYCTGRPFNHWPPVCGNIMSFNSVCLWTRSKTVFQNKN